MFDNMKLAAGRATALAAANKVVNSKLHLGMFIYKCDISVYSLKDGALAGSECYPIVGLTNTNKLVNLLVVIVYKKDRGEGFPIEKAIVTSENLFRVGNAPKMNHFECTFPDGNIEMSIKELEKSPHEVVEEAKPIPDKSEEPKFGLI